MRKHMSEDLLAHYRQPIQTITQCLRIERSDGQIIGLTAHDQAIFFEGVYYHSAAGYQATAVQANTGLAVGTVEIEGLLSAAGVARAALAAGLFDQARIEIFEVNYENMSQGRLLLLAGFWGETQMQGDRYVTECRSLAQTLQQPMGELYSASCRAQLGDVRCGVKLAAFTHRARVTEVISLTELVAADLTPAEDYFQYGTLRWESGANLNTSSAIKNVQADGHWVLIEAPPYPVTVGDAFAATAGCNKRLATCRTRFDNTVNFRGEPFVPGQDQLSKYPDVK